MDASGSLRRAAAREAAILVIAAAGSLLFFIHGTFEPPIGFRMMAITPWVFALLTAVVYLFIRMLFMVGAMFFPRKQPELVLCPECGRYYDDSTPDRIADHRRVELTPKPTEREILAAIMLRKAIDDARRSAKRPLAGPDVTMAELPGEVENPPISIDEFDRILRDLDFSKGPRRGPPDRRPKGPPGPP